MKEIEQKAIEIERRLAKEHCYGFPELIGWIVEALHQTRLEALTEVIIILEAEAAYQAQQFSAKEAVILRVVIDQIRTLAKTREGRDG